MLGQNKTDTYYAISARYDKLTKKIITVLAETDGATKFEFVASFDKIVDSEISSLLKKARGYSFAIAEVNQLTASYSQEISLSIKSILTENNIKLTDIDFINIENLALDENFKLDIATPIFQEFNIPVIYNIDLSDNSEFLIQLAKTKNIDKGVLINLDQNFDIYKLNSKAHLVSETLGFSILYYLAMYLNIEQDQLSHLIAQGSIDEGIINKVSKIEKLEDLQKELINLIVFSSISTQDKLKTAFVIIKSLLIKDLAEFDNHSKIVVIGNTTLVEELNQEIKEIFEHVEFLKNQSQRQDTLISEHMLYLAAKKYTVENYNNGVKIS